MRNVMKRRPWLLTAAALGLLVFSISLRSTNTRTQENASAARSALAVKIDFNQRVKMRDGVELSADVYRPDAAGRFPVILSRTPYNKNSAGTLRQASAFASRGYVWVEMDVRGRGDSDGRFVPYRNEGRDGYDAIEWCAGQSWSSGKVGTIGASYNGINQWLAAVEQPPHLTTMIVLVPVSDPFIDGSNTGPTGLPGPMIISWYHYTAGRVLQNMDAVDWGKIHWHLPLASMDEAAGRPNPSWKDIFDHPAGDPWWEPARYQNKLERVRIPVLHIAGWYDDVQPSTLNNFIGMTAKAASEEVRSGQRLLMGPWPHATNSARKLGTVDFGPSAVIDLMGYQLRWFDSWLKGEDTGIRSEPAVRLFVMGENRWRDENEWPLARTRWTKYYLHSGGRANSLFGNGALSPAEPAAEPADAYMTDPMQPVPFITEPSFAQLGGPDDYRPIERRDDVLVFSSEPLQEDTEICGPIRVRLYAASSAPDTDFMAKLIDVWPDGFAQRLTDGMVRARFRDGMERPSLIQPGRVYAYDIDCWNTCQSFKQGHRIRLEIASSAFPKYDRNLNTGEPLGRTTRMQTAEQTIYHNREYPSHVLLPVIPKKVD